MRRNALLAGSVMTILALSACGGGSTPATTTSSSSSSSSATSSAAAPAFADLTGDEILAKAKTALTKAPSVHIKGSVQDGADSVGIDLQLNGTGASGTVKMAGMNMKIIRIGATLYIAGDAAFWKTSTGSAEAARTFQGKYLKTSLSSKDFAQVAALTDLTTAADTFLDPSGKLTKGSIETINGQPAIGLVDTDGTLYVAAEGEPYPLRIAATDAAGGQIDFTDYGKNLTITAPPASKVIDPSKPRG